MLRRHTPRALEMAPVIDLPTGNVTLAPLAVPAQSSRDDRERTPDEPTLRPGTWSVRDGHGCVVATDLATRAAALRLLGALAFRGAELPLTVDGPDGRPTGDRLA